MYLRLWSPTIVWDDGPGHGGGVDAPDHPEHAQPAQVLSPLLPRQHLHEVGEHDGDRPSDPEEGRGGRQEVTSR